MFNLARRTRNVSGSLSVDIASRSYFNKGRILSSIGTLRKRSSGKVMAVVLVLILSVLSIEAASAGGSCTPPHRFPNPVLLNALQRGVNLPDWDHSDRSQRPGAMALKALRAQGLTHIRLLLNNNRLSDASSSVYLNEIYDELISLISMGYVVSLDLHADDAVSKKFAEGYETGFLYLQSIWKKVALMAQVLDSEKVALELLNEPNIGQEDWMRAADGLIDTIRQIAPQHTIIVGPSGPQRHETLSGMQPFEDPNIVYAIHYYDPFLFTHQGATWGRETDPLRVMRGLPFPASLRDARIVKILADLDTKEQFEAATAIRKSLDRDWNEDTLREAFDIMAGWAKTYSRPVIINEFGVLDFVVDRQSRLNWLATVNRLARQRCLGWTHWDFQQGFGLIDRKTRLPDAGIMRALRDAD